MSMVELVSELEASGFCSVCLMPNSNDIHDSCRVFSGIDPASTHSRLSRIKLEEYDGDWVKLLTTALYGLLVPWDLQVEDLPVWFSSIETLLLSLEDGDIHPSNVVSALMACEGDFYSLRRIAKDKTYSLADGFRTWNLRNSTTPVDFFARSLQLGRTKVRKEKLRGCRTVLKSLYKDMLDNVPEELPTRPTRWDTLEETTRSVFLAKATEEPVSLRLLNGRPLISSTFDLRGRWLGWALKEKGLLAMPELGKPIPKGIAEEDTILTRWNRLVETRSEVATIKRIVRAHGREIIGNPDPKKTDAAAFRSNAEIVKPGSPTIFDQFARPSHIDRIVPTDFTVTPKKMPYSSLEKKGTMFLTEHTRFQRPRSKIQARAVGWVIGSDNSLCTIVMPTGTGKSLIPLCAAIESLLGGKKGTKRPLVVVVCPLIALLEDQVITARADAMQNELKSDDGHGVSLLHHTRDLSERRDTLKALRNGECVLLFLTAEQLQRESTLEAVGHRPISWLFIDEAHGVLEFEDYRPAYARIWYPIQRLKQRSPKMGVAIQSATLPLEWEKRVWEKLIRSREYPRPAIFRSTAIRRNLVFDYVEEFNADERSERNDSSLDRTIENVKQGKRTILYTLWRQKYFDEMWKTLTSELQDFAIGCYSGGGSKLSTQDARNKRLPRDEFVKKFSNGEIEATLATLAFGLGINRRDVRSVVFNGIPSSLNTLYQQAGRSGRGIDVDGRYEHKGEISIYCEKGEDFGHQRHLTSLQRLHGTTTCRVLECMKNSEKSRVLAEGFYLLDTDAESNSRIDPGPSVIDRKNNLNALRILSDVGALEWIAVLPFQIRIPFDAISSVLRMDPEKFLENHHFERIEGDMVKANTCDLLSSGFKGRKQSISHSYQLIQDLAMACMDSSIAWDVERASFALVAWLWEGSKEDLERAISDWRVTDVLAYSTEEDFVGRFLYQEDHDSRMRVLSEYFGFCGMNCRGCEGCK